MTINGKKVIIVNMPTIAGVTAGEFYWVKETMVDGRKAFVTVPYEEADPEKSTRSVL